jgi:hypothetical protein
MSVLTDSQLLVAALAGRRARLRSRAEFRMNRKKRCPQGLAFRIVRTRASVDRFLTLRGLVFSPVADLQS